VLEHVLLVAKVESVIEPLLNPGAVLIRHVFEALPHRREVARPDGKCVCSGVAGRLGMALEPTPQA